MAEKTILFSTPMVQAILAGRKTMTRRVVKPQPDDYGLHNHTDFPMSIDSNLQGWWGTIDETGSDKQYHPYQLGDILWVREAWAVNEYDDYRYKADVSLADPFYKWEGVRWRPSIFMPREAARIFLKVTNVRVERLQDITEEDVRAEGISKTWLLNWLSKQEDHYPSNWIYWDSERRYWCDRHIDKAVKEFRRDVLNGTIKIDDFQNMNKEEIKAEIGYIHDGCVEEEHPVMCETCHTPLQYSALDSVLDDFEELLECYSMKDLAPTIDSLLCNYEKELFKKKNIHRMFFAKLWDELNAKRGCGWDANPWVFVVSFIRVKT
jgi:hypothetical protein